MNGNQLNGRKIGIITDAHGLLEPTKAALEDMQSKGIVEIYSLGDNIGLGPNPSEVVDLLEEYNVKSLAGNSEDYLTLGTAPFDYIGKVREQSELWTASKINEHQKGIISLYPHFIELLIAKKRVALCHFANDVRFDYNTNSTWSYQKSLENGKEAYKQFLYTNSEEQLKDIRWRMQHIAKIYGTDSLIMRGYISALKEPLFAGKKVDFFDAVIQGHVHWKIYEKSPSTEFYSIRAVGMAYKKDPVDTASYIVLEETPQGLKFSEHLVCFDREKMIYSILSSDEPSKRIKTFTAISKEEEAKYNSWKR